MATKEIVSQAGRAHPPQFEGESDSNQIRRRLAGAEPKCQRTYTPSLAVLGRSAGSYHWTPEGRRLADFTSGVLVANLGHNPTRWWQRVMQYLQLEEQLDTAQPYTSMLPLTAYNAVTALEVDCCERLIANMQREPGGARIELALPDGGSAMLLDESYNANPASMAAALAVLKDTPARRRIAVLGAMRELGDRSDALHAALNDPIRSAGVAELALVGGEMEALKLDRASHLPDWEAALAWARGMLRDGDALLVKGSNSVGLGQLVAALASGSDAGGRP